MPIIWIKNNFISVNTKFLDEPFSSGLNKNPTTPPECLLYKSNKIQLGYRACLKNKQLIKVF